MFPKLKLGVRLAKLLFDQESDLEEPELWIRHLREKQGEYYLRCDLRIEI